MPRLPLDHHLISDEPFQLFMGALPEVWDDVPARVVVNLCGIFPFGNSNRRIVYTLPMLDVADEALMPDRSVVEGFVDAIHAYADHEPTYWHCHAGLNRSGLAVAAYLHRHRGVRIGAAIGLLRARRSRMVLCNPLFERRLRQWYGGPEEQAFVPVSMDLPLPGPGTGPDGL